MRNSRFSQEIVVFHGRRPPVAGLLVGYGAIIDALALPMPMPTRLALIGSTTKRYRGDDWQVLTPRHRPEDDLYAHLVFALKYEGVDLLFFKRLFERITEKEIVRMLALEPNGKYSRRIWFLYEWLMDKRLAIPDISMMNYIPLLDPAQQSAVPGTPSPRHRIINNLPGTRDFCPLVRKTPKLEALMEAYGGQRGQAALGRVRSDIMQRASAFLLLKDSKASFTIEGESPKSKRAARWGQAIGQAGMNPLSKDELVRLQQLVIESDRFTRMGYREQGGFVGEHDRTTGEPLPDHISARWQDVDMLMQGLIATHEQLVKDEFDAVVAAAMISFGFVFIHPFVDGNGRLHRYLIHHVLARKKFAKPGIIFPVSAAILDHIDDYRHVLETYSRPLLDHIDWKTTKNNNLDVLNDTADLYRYFDATPQAEFLYERVAETIERIIPEEVQYLIHYDEMKRYLDNAFEMPDKTVDLLMRFLEQGDGKLSARALKQEFSALKKAEVSAIEVEYANIFKGE
jgi:Fic/DOC family